MNNAMLKAIKTRIRNACIRRKWRVAREKLLEKKIGQEAELQTLKAWLQEIKPKIKSALEELSRPEPDMKKVNNILSLFKIRLADAKLEKNAF